MTVLVTAAVVVLALILIGAAGFIVYKKKQGEREKNVSAYRRSDEKVNTVSTKQTEYKQILSLSE